MITEETVIEKSCLFCASDYHLEMILLPYICKKVKKERIIVITQDDLDSSINLVLDRINIEKSLKNEIWNLGWKSKENKLEILEEEGEKVNFIINGNFSFICQENKKIEKLKEKLSKKKSINIVNCFHLDDKEVDIQSLHKKYKIILNTIKI